jgi:hypothetical protein
LARKVLHLDRKFYVKYSAAKSGIDVGAWVWVEEGISIRNATRSEAIDARRNQDGPRALTVVTEASYSPRPKVQFEPLWDGWVDQQGRCADRPKAESCEICGKTCKTVFDHCHETEIFRGWLCGRCNSMLGFALDDPETLRNGAKYLETFTRKLNEAMDGIALSRGESEQRVSTQA